MNFPPGSIITYTGKRFYPLDPNSDDVDPIDIAHSLANQCRYTGHTKFHYSVATHSVLMYDHIKSLGYGLDVLTQVIIHDAGEAYLLDLAAPLKHHPEGFGDKFVEVEEAIEDVVCKRFDIEQPFDPIVKEVDIRLRVNELSELFPPNVAHVDYGAALPVKIPMWTPNEGKTQFLFRMEECGLVWRGPKGVSMYSSKESYALA